MENDLDTSPGGGGASVQTCPPGSVSACWRCDHLRGVTVTKVNPAVYIKTQLQHPRQDAVSPSFSSADFASFIKAAAKNNILFRWHIRKLSFILMSSELQTKTEVTIMKCVRLIKVTIVTIIHKWCD